MGEFAGKFQFQIIRLILLLTSERPVKLFAVHFHADGDAGSRQSRLGA